MNGERLKQRKTKVTTEWFWNTYCACPHGWTAGSKMDYLILVRCHANHGPVESGLEFFEEPLGLFVPDSNIASEFFQAGKALLAQGTSTWIYKKTVSHWDMKDLRWHTTHPGEYCTSPSFHGLPLWHFPTFPLAKTFGALLHLIIFCTESVGAPSLVENHHYMKVEAVWVFTRYQHNIISFKSFTSFSNMSLEGTWCAAQPKAPPQTLKRSVHLCYMKHSRYHLSSP